MTVGADTIHCQFSQRLEAPSKDWKLEMMMGRGGPFGLLVGSAVGTLLLLPAPGSAQDSLSVSCADVAYLTPLQDLIRCAEQGMAGAQFFLGARHDRGGGCPLEHFGSRSLVSVGG